MKSQSVPDPRMEEAIALMMRFAEQTGLMPGHSRQRYLWTDAFAVCNYLGLARATGEQRYRQLALQLIEQVHQTLGRYASHDPRTGWISGLSDPLGEAHPIGGGLRIGKPRPERAPGEPLDEQQEWDRDGQYFHYLTKWMHALDQATRSTGEPVFNQWAQELARSAREAFIYTAPSGRGKRMYWKMSIDLSRPLVPTMGQHDPLDGLITYTQLQSTAAVMSGQAQAADIGRAIDDFASMLDHRTLATPDPLGIGGLLVDAARTEQLMRQGAFADGVLLENLLAAALAGLEYYVQRGELQYPTDQRLAFRELGLAIGLHAITLMNDAPDANDGQAIHTRGTHKRLKALMHYAPLRFEIESYWRDPAHQQAPTWREHRDINEVMLATSLAPEGCLVLPSPPWQ